MPIVNEHPHMRALVTFQEKFCVFLWENIDSKARKKIFDRQVQRARFQVAGLSSNSDALLRRSKQTNNWWPGEIMLLGPTYVLLLNNFGQS